MKKCITSIEKRIENAFINNRAEIIFSLLAGVITYLLLMTGDLVNDVDGLWHPSNFIAGDWEISLGRGLQRYADRARFGIVSAVLNSVLTLSLISVSNVCIVNVLGIKDKLYRYAALLLMVANPIVCNSLTYSYMSVNFGLAWFFAVCAVLPHAQKETSGKSKHILAVLGSGLLLGIAMAFYQAYICVTAIVLLFLFIKNILEEQKLKKIGCYACKVLLSVLAGGCFYLIITKLLLWRADVEMSGYKGASNVGVGSIISNLPNSVAESYKQYWNYIKNGKMFSALEFMDVLIIGLLVVYLIAVLFRFVKLLKAHKVHALLYLIAVLLIPVASCAVILIAVGNSMTVLMSMGMLMSIVLLGSIIEDKSFWIKRIHCFLIIALAWFQLSAVINDQLALREGKDATITLTENVVSELITQGYLEDVAQPVAFVGQPGSSPMFMQSVAYQTANGYARFGCWSTDSRNNRYSWLGVTSNFLGISMNICDEYTYEEIRISKEIADMPVFPGEGSVRIIDGVVVVKVSELY